MGEESGEAPEQLAWGLAFPEAPRAGPCGVPTRLSHEAFPQGFPTGLSHVPPCCESILGLKVGAVQEKEVSLEWTETSGELWECGRTLEFLSPFLWRAPPLEV